ncbi:MAG: divergent polysaccharide deacetylase family protein, partial [Campylobacterota bacterium]|nr:divergent polysaccharide deacetylase family protein [Campylobacterota bacterium]
IFNLTNLLIIIIIISTTTTIYIYQKNKILQLENELQKQEIAKQKIKLENEIIKQYNLDNQRAKLFEEKTKALEIEYSTPIDNQLYLHTTPTKEPKETIDKKVVNKEIVEKEIIEKKIIKKEKDIVVSKKPKLIIIIDDVTTQRQIDKIKDIGYPVNMSFLPPIPRHKYSAKITKNLDYYMIHLPLEASSYKNNEDKTLLITDSYETIENRIKELKELYPNAKYINNHTGSKFTGDTESMDKLLRALKKYNLIFVDSRTTAKSVVKDVAKKYGMQVFSRNIFLDNKKDKEYITKQLKRAIKISKKHGSAIAIGHPYSITISTLKDVKDLLKDLDVIYMEQI